jgi:hypothetical protein
MNASSDSFDYSKYKTIDKFNSTKKLKKIHYRVYSKCYSTDLFFNRAINEEKVNELYNVISNEENDIPWICHAIVDMKTDKKLIVDGQHRHEAISKYIKKDTRMECDKYLYIFEHKIEDLELESCRLDVINLLKKLNNNMPFNEDELPSNKIAEFIAKLKFDSALTEGIGYNTDTQTCYKSKIHQKELFELFNKNAYLTKSMTIDEMINNLRTINHHLSQMTREKLYRGIKLNKNAIENAEKMVFYLGLKDSAYPPRFWIKYIQNPHDIAI